MRSSIATYRESLSRIAGEVDDAAADELPALLPPYGETSTPPSSGRRRRHSRAGSAEPDEITKYKADIQKLQASEAEIKALSFNYAAMLKEKEEQLAKLRDENGSLRRSLESSRTLSSNSNGTLEQSPSRVQRSTVQENALNASKQNGYGSGAPQNVQPNGVHKMTVYHKGDLLEEDNTSFAAHQATLENENKQLKQQLKNEFEKETEIKNKLEDENKRNEFLQRQLSELNINMKRKSADMEELHKELNDKKSELRHMQDELNKKHDARVSEGPLQSLRSMVMALQKENSELKLEKGRLEAEHVSMKNATQKNDDDSSDTKVSDLEKVAEEMSSSITSLKKALQDSSLERDKALQDLARLKQHLLDKDLEDQEKMDEDSRLIEELRANCEQQRVRIMQLERALRLEMAKGEESKKSINEEFHKSKELIEDLRYKLANCMSALESKNEELLNLQTALGQYYAESEAKERLGGDLAMAREELAKMSGLLKIANQGNEILRREKEEVAAKLSQAERMLADGKLSMQKLEEDNSRLRRALEQSMTTLNRMSLDSDNYVDRRIVIKLLVTYFQRNHSKEVLDLMVRLLGFSEEDKQRIGFAQNTAGKGVVRGVLGLPGRLVGGILGGHSADASAQTSPDNQSFADLWVDFLLKETEEREKRETAEAARLLQEDQTASTSNSYSVQQSGYPANLAPGPSTKPQLFGRSDADFATIPLTSSTVQYMQSSISRPPA